MVRVKRAGSYVSFLNLFILQLQIPSGLLVVEFPSSSSGQRRRKKEWVIPPYSITENERGSFPRKLFPTVYLMQRYSSIIGEGTDQPPVDIFIIDKKTGYLFVTQPLDREKKEDGKKIPSPTNLTIIVIDKFLNFYSSVTEGYESMTVTATDADEPGNYNSEIRCKIVSLLPPSPNPNMFEINTLTGRIYVNYLGLDKEVRNPIVATDMEGIGLANTGTAVITITDSNDNLPQFEQISHTISVPENKVGAVVLDQPAWSTKYRIISGDKGGFFNVSTGPTQLEGIITTVKPLDFEKTKQYVLSVIVENDEPFAGSLPTSTATVTVNVEDVNEPPEFNTQEKVISRHENLPVDSDLVAYTATEPDTRKSQKITYKIGKDPAGWLNQDTGMIKSSMDRESALVKDVSLCLNTDENPATGTGTLVIELEDVNDNAPIINEEIIEICNRKATVLLSITDKDGPLYAAPFSVEPHGDTKKNWTARMNETSKDNVYWKNMNYISSNSSLGVYTNLFICLLWKLGFYDDIRDNVCCYDEEGGGEDDQNYDLSVLHQGLDNRQRRGSYFLACTSQPPYDSLLVFDYEGGGSDAGSLSSLNSSSSGHDQDYDFLNEWGPRFKKLADMYGGGEN
uniref:Cadherin-1 n=1 Tax=Sinocyclocheilus rhinocerous TaxID=307959 RepID=A0A673G878_9TELE